MYETFPVADVQPLIGGRVDTDNRPIAAIACGGRDYAERIVVRRVLVEVNPVILIHGAAPGADTLADEEARRLLDCRIDPYPADWTRLKKAAGPIRNQQMLDALLALSGYRKIILAFPGGTGTADMMNKGRNAGIEIVSSAQVLLSIRPYAALDLSTLPWR